MRNTHTCPKCRSTDVLRIPTKLSLAGVNNIPVGATILSAVPLTRYLCGACGFSEQWVDDRTDVERLRAKFSV